MVNRMYVHTFFMEHTAKGLLLSFHIQYYKAGKLPMVLVYHFLWARVNAVVFH